MIGISADNYGLLISGNFGIVLLGGTAGRLCDMIIDKSNKLEAGIRSGFRSSSGRLQ